VKVAGLQMDIAWENPEQNFARTRAAVDEAAAAGHELVVLPEMFATGFSMNTEAVVPQAPAIISWLEETARAAGIWLAAGLGVAPPEGELLPRNACLIFDPEGRERLRFHKIHPFSLVGEEKLYGAGDELVTLEISGVRVTPLICYDLRFPEPFRIAAPRTDLFLVIANWPSRRAEAWQALLRARAIENQSFVLGVNRVGVAEGIAHRGDSALVDPWGAYRMSLATREGLVGGEVDPDDVRTARERFSFLADRRPGVYRRLEEQEN
jgi:omega-amidase